jgi:F420H(2)-dependent quinone reductase
MPLTGDYEPSAREFVRDQVDTIENSDGRDGNERHGRPVVVVTCRGAKTGKLRKVPLMRVEHDGVYAAVASLGGSANNPVWYYNLLADPHVEVRDAAHVVDMTAREVHGQERALWWDRAVAAFPTYAEYQTKTDREIPVFVLEPGV